MSFPLALGFLAFAGITDLLEAILVLIALLGILTGIVLRYMIKKRNVEISNYRYGVCCHISKIPPPTEKQFNAAWKRVMSENREKSRGGIYRRNGGR